MSQLSCKKCQSERYVKSGHTRGHQRYKCKDCGCQYTNTKRIGVHPALKSFAIVLYAYCGVSMGKITAYQGHFESAWINNQNVPPETQVTLFALGGAKCGKKVTKWMKDYKQDKSSHNL